LVEKKLKKKKEKKERKEKKKCGLKEFEKDKFQKKSIIN